MASGIPPFLPASPPPMCKLDFYDDDDDDFGDFSNAAENCYQDDISITKSAGDDKVSNASQVFDPGSDYQTSNEETLIHNHDYSTDDFVHQDASITLPLKNDFNFNEEEVNEPDNTDKINDPEPKDIPNDSVKEDDPIFEPIPESNSNNNDSRAYSNDDDDDSSVEDSTSDSLDKNMAENQTNRIDSETNLPSENHINANGKTNKSENDLALDSEFGIPESSTEVEDDYSAFCSVTEPKESLENDSNSKQTETRLQRAFSEDSDDSNTPDIDFNCFITCPQDLGKPQDGDTFASFDNKSCDDEFGDFATPAGIDFTSSHPASSIQLDENEQSGVQTCLNAEPTPRVTTDQSDSLSVDPMDDDFSDFVSTTTPSSIENAERVNLLDQSKSSEANSTRIISNRADLTTLATTSSSNDFEQMYDLSSECWNEIFQISNEEQIEVNLNTFEGKLNGSSVWCKIKDIETSPALNYNWNNSETQKILLSALYVDSRNILFGPRWNSDVPRFASNLGFSPLVPEKASEKKDTQPVSISPPTILPEEPPVVDDNAPKVPASVPEAHFDWNNSGLTNPLDSRRSERAKPSGASTYENSLLAKTPHRKELSEEAKEILNNLPNLFVMEKQYIVFPVS